MRHHFITPVLNRLRVRFHPVLPIPRHGDGGVQLSPFPALGAASAFAPQDRHRRGFCVRLEIRQVHLLPCLRVHRYLPFLTVTKLHSCFSPPLRSLVPLGIRRLEPVRAKSQVPRDARYWWTYQRRRGNAGTVVQLTSGHHPQRAQNWLATDPSTSGHQPHNWSGRRLLFNLVGIFKLVRLRSCNSERSPPTVVPAKCSTYRRQVNLPSGSFRFLNG